MFSVYITGHIIIFILLALNKSLCSGCSTKVHNAAWAFQFTDILQTIRFKWFSYSSTSPMHSSKLLTDLNILLFTVAKDSLLFTINLNTKNNPNKFAKAHIILSVTIFFLQCIPSISIVFICYGSGIFRVLQ